MELKVWVDGVQRIVCGVTEVTTCQEVVIALAQAIGETLNLIVNNTTMAPFLKDLLFHVLYVPFHAPFVPPFLRTQHNTHYGCLLDNKPSLRSEIKVVKCSIVPSSLRV